MTPTKLQMSLKVHKYNFVLKFKFPLNLLSNHPAVYANYPYLHH